MEATAPDWITAVATAIAAIGAVGALIYAARASKAARASATAANTAIKAEMRPLLLDVPHEHYTDYDHEYPWPSEGMRKSSMRGLIAIDYRTGEFVFPVRNVGRGAARIESFSITLSKTGACYEQYGAIAVPVGEDIWLAGTPPPGQEFAQSLRRTPAPVHGPMPFICAVAYTDIAGGQQQRLELGVGVIGRDSALRVIRIAHIALDS